MTCYNPHGRGGIPSTSRLQSRPLWPIGEEGLILPALTSPSAPRPLQAASPPPPSTSPHIHSVGVSQKQYMKNLKIHLTCSWTSLQTARKHQATVSLNPYAQWVVVCMLLLHRPFTLNMSPSYHWRAEKTQADKRLHIHHRRCQLGDICSSCACIFHSHRGSHFLMKAHKTTPPPPSSPSPCRNQLPESDESMPFISLYCPMNDWFPSLIIQIDVLQKAQCDAVHALPARRLDLKTPTWLFWQMSS